MQNEQPPEKYVQSAVIFGAIWAIISIAALVATAALLDRFYP